ncbi:MAG: UbiD family decarboxylase [Bauldia sp.]|nr:UbiD family decarboxylase [Bauldia sp.]
MPSRTLPAFRSLGDFIAHLEAADELVRVSEPISVVHEMTEIHRRVLRGNGRALLFEHAVKADGARSEMPVLVNLFGTLKRIAWGLGVEADALPALGEAMAELSRPEMPDGLGEVLRKLPLARAALSMRPRQVNGDVDRRTVLSGEAVDLTRLPAQVSWPGEPGPLITWPLVITRGPEAGTPENVGVYRIQILGRDSAIIRWLPHRGGAGHHRMWRDRGMEMPVAVVIGADPATMLAAVFPLPETLSELRFAGLLRGERPRLASCVSVPLRVPADAEIVIEGFVSPTQTAPEGPYGDHTGYYGDVESFPVTRVTAMTMRKKPVYLSTFTGRPPDEPSRIGEALNILFLPLIRRSFPEITDLWFPPEACSYRIAVVAIDKRYPGQARRVMLGLWSILPQLSYTKFLILVDHDINVRDWEDVAWAVSTRSDPSRDLVVIDGTPIDNLDFASPKLGLGGKLGIDATNKIGSETERKWGRRLAMDPAIVGRIDEIWDRLGVDPRASAARGAA